MGRYIRYIDSLALGELFQYEIGWAIVGDDDVLPS